MPLPFDAQVSYRFGVPLIYVEGELDYESVDELREVIDEELSSDQSVLLLEFSRLAYMDSRGLSLLFSTLERLRGTGWLGVVNPKPNVRKLAEMTGLADRDGFLFIEDLESVPAAIGERSKEP
jgi:anti-anti-sigma factor